MKFKKVVIIGLDGFDPVRSEAMMAAGELPNLAELREKGGYARLATTLPAQTPVAWSTFAVGANPGSHGIFDFLRRDPATYLPEMGLYRHEQQSRFLPPKAVNLRGGRPVWDRLSKAGIPSVVLRHPCTYPPAALKGRILAGVGVPDLRGGYGSSSYFTSDSGAAPGENEHVSQVQLDGAGRGQLELSGPLLPKGDELLLGLELEVDEGGCRAQISCPDGSFSHAVDRGQWTGWVSVRFKHGRLQTIRGLVKFFLASTNPLRLFASPVHFDPDSPLFPISYPWDYAGELRRALGSFATLGLAEEHNGMTNGRLDENAFLTHCLDIMHERRAMMHYELARHREGLFYCLFGTPDRVQHMFWRLGEAGHPANRGKPLTPEWTHVIGDYYRRCDEIVGNAMAYSDPDTLFIVLSDHGFTSFQRKVHLNSWLHRFGYLVLKNGVEPGEGSGDLLRNVDWGRTRAYALGLAGLYLNLRGREADGIVAPSEAAALRQEISHRLGGLQDPQRGTTAVRRAFPRESVYSGPFAEDAPDVLLACAPGYRISSATAMGGLGPDLLTDNTRLWSGDHAVDPHAVPGVLFMNSPFRGENAHLVDLAPTLLQAFGVPGDEELEGESLLF